MTAHLPPVWRLLDTGVRRAAENMALNRALLEARQSDVAPNTIRFLGFEPSALLGFHQSAEQELDLDYCATNGVTVQRRITGGGAIYMDSDQLGWELYVDRRALGLAEMSQIAGKICTAAAAGLQQLGVNAQFRPRNDIEVEGRKLSGTGGAFDGEALMYQGTLLMRFDVEKMLRVLRIPAEKLADKAIASARDRVTSLAALLAVVPERAVIITTLSKALADAFGVSLQAGELNAAEMSLYEVALKEIDHPDWVYGVSKPATDRPTVTAQRKFAGGTLRVNVAYDMPQQRLRQVWFSGDVFISPRRTLMDLESCLRDVLIGRMPVTVEDFFAERQVDALGITPQNIVELIQEALVDTQVV